MTANTLKKIRLFWILTLLATLATLTFTGCGASNAEKEVLKQSNYHYQLAVSHFGGNEVPQAIRELTLSLEQNPQNAEALHLMGFVYMGRKQYPEAVRYFRESLAAKPDYLICKNNLGVAYLFMERWEDAATIYEELRTETLYTSPWLAYANLGWAYYQMGRLDEAVEQTEMALFLNPEMCLASNNLGIMHADLFEAEKAMMHFEEALELCPQYPEPHLHLGQLLAEAGDLKKAQKHFRQCTQLSPKSELGQRCKRNAKLYR